MIYISGAVFVILWLCLSCQ